MASWNAGWAIVLAAAVGAPVAAVEGGPETSRTFAYATYKERRGAVTILIDSLPASFRDGEAYIPVPVAIGFQDYGEGLTVSPEVFSLIDRTGRTYGAASYEEVVRDYPRLLFDGGFVAGRPVTSQQFALSRRVPSRFYPPPGVGARIARVHVDSYTWFRDVIYFPRPEAGLDGVLTLRVHGGGIDPPVDVRFRVPLPGVPIR